MINNDAAIFEADHANKEANAGAHGDAEIPGNADEHPLPKAGDGEDDK